LAFAPHQVSLERPTRRMRPSRSKLPARWRRNRAVSVYIGGWRVRATDEDRSGARQIRSATTWVLRSDEPELRSLMLAGLDGDASAHKSLLAKLVPLPCAPILRDSLRVSAGGPPTAEDLVQETLIALHTRRHTYDRSQLLTPWVYAIARYRLVDYLRPNEGFQRACADRGSGGGIGRRRPGGRRQHARSQETHGQARAQDEKSNSTRSSSMD